MSRKRDATRQYDVLDAIRAYKGDHGFSPSMRDLMGMTGITSLSVVNYYLRLLETGGLIRRTANISRSIELTTPTFRTPPLTGSGQRPMKKIDQRKTSSAETNAKKAAAGRMGNGGNALMAKTSKKDPGLQARIEMVVERALERPSIGPNGDQEYDVIRLEARRLHVHGAHKIG